MDRDCDSCARCGRSGCTSWDCGYINRDEAIKAWEEKFGKVGANNDDIS